MTPDKKELDRLFRQFMEGTCTPQERQLLWEWFFLLDLRSQQMIRDEHQEEAVREEMRSVILAQVTPLPKRAKVIRWQLAAAAVLVGALFTVALFLLVDGPRKKDLLATVISNDSAAVISFYLPDSSRVILSRSSRLTWTEDFNTHERRVSLSGEGYFDIHPDPKHPFIVESNGLETKALGTAFTIEAYDDEAEMRVSLIHGSVVITDTNNRFYPSYLVPGQLLRYRYEQKDFHIEKIPVSDPLAWIYGGMTFNRIPLSEALNRLARRYDLRVQYDPVRLKGKTVSGSFNPTSWEKLLPNVLFIHDLHYQVKDSTIQIMD